MKLRLLLEVLRATAYQIDLLVVLPLLDCLYVRSGIKLRLRIRQVLLDIIATDLCVILLNYLL